MWQTYASVLFRDRKISCFGSKYSNMAGILQSSKISCSVTLKKGLKVGSNYSLLACNSTTITSSSRYEMSLTFDVSMIWFDCRNVSIVRMKPVAHKNVNVSVFGVNVNTEGLFSFSCLPCAAFTFRPTEPLFVFQVALLDQEPLAGWLKQLRMVSLIPSPAQRWPWKCWNVSHTM